MSTSQTRIQTQEHAPALAGIHHLKLPVSDLTRSSREDIEVLAAHLIEYAEQHAGVHWASIGWILPLLHDPEARRNRPQSPRNGRSD